MGQISADGNRDENYLPKSASSADEFSLACVPKLFRYHTNGINAFVRSLALCAGQNFKKLHVGSMESDAVPVTSHSLGLPGPGSDGRMSNALQELFLSASTSKVEDIEVLIDIIKITALNPYLDLDQFDFLVPVPQGSVFNKLVYEVNFVTLSGIRSVEAHFCL